MLPNPAYNIAMLLAAGYHIVSLTINLLQYRFHASKFGISSLNCLLLAVSVGDYIVGTITIAIG